MATPARVSLPVRQDAERFRTVFDLAAVGMARVDFASARWLEVNDALCELVGYSREEMLATPWPQITHPEDVDLDLQPFRRMAAGEIDSYSVDKRFIHKRGHTVWARLNLSLARDGEGRPDYEIAVIEDISDRKRAEAELAEREERLRESLAEQERSHAVLDAMLESLPTAVILADPDGRLVRWNRANERLWGLRGVEPASTHSIADYAEWKGWWYPSGERVQPEEWAMARALLKREVVLGDVVEVEPFDGSDRRVIVNVGAPVVGTHGELLGAVIAQTDITDRVRSEKQREELLAAERRARIELAEREAEFRAMADNIPQLAWMADATGSIYWYNQRWYDFTGTTLEECQGWGWRRVHHPDHIDAVTARLKHAWDTGEPWEDTFPMRGKDGEYRWFLSRAMPIRDAAGKVVRWFGTNTDITQQREVERELAQADRRKDEFLAMLAHELRNPLAPLSNALAILERSRDAAVQATAHSTMRRQLRHLVRLVDDLLEVSRITTGKLKLNVDRVELQRVLQQAIETAGPKIDAGGHRLVVEPARREIWLMGDRVRLAQVFTNLLDNAAKYTERGGTITLRVDLSAPGRVRVAVQDTGLGIDAASLPHVFDLFTQVDQGTDKAQGGLGIGLSLARRLVELHGGRVEAASAGAGMGSTFIVELPMAQAPAPPPVADEECEEPGGATCRVLVADDNRDAADTLAMMLSIGRHEVTVTYGGREAIEAARRQVPELAILDIGMPHVDGYEVARTLRRELGERCPVLIALTGWGQENDKRRATEAGFDHHFTKPIDPAHIESVIHALCRTEAKAADG